MRTEYIIHPRKVGLILGGIASVLAILSLISEYLVEVVLAEGANSVRVLILDLFSVNLEESIPTWYSTLNLFIAAVLLAVIARAKLQSRDRYRWYWAGLAAIFLYLSMDEGAVIHEIFADPLQQAFHAGGFFAFGWQILAIPLVAIFGVAYLRFLFHLPGHMQKLFVLACGMYIGGALFADGISASQWSADTGVSMIYLSIATVEELLEMMGVVVFIYGLLRYIVEMNHLVVLGSEVAVGSSSKTGDSAVMPINNTPDQTAPKMWRLLRPSLLLIVLLIGTNIALLSWIVSNRPTELANSSTTLFYQSIDEPLAQNDVTILQIPGTYDPKNIFMRQMTSSLLSEYAEVMVVVIPPIESSYIFAGAVLPFDRDSLVELLHSDGKFEFVIFETAVVRALVGDTETPTSSG